jgi:hypothetical protein
MSVHSGYNSGSVGGSRNQSVSGTDGLFGNEPSSSTGATSASSSAEGQPGGLIDQLYGQNNLEINFDDASLQSIPKEHQWRAMVIINTCIKFFKDRDKSEMPIPTFIYVSEFEFSFVMKHWKCPIVLGALYEPLLYNIDVTDHPVMAVYFTQDTSKPETMANWPLAKLQIDFNFKRIFPPKQIIETPPQLDGTTYGQIRKAHALILNGFIEADKSVFINLVGILSRIQPDFVLGYEVQPFKWHYIVKVTNWHGPITGEHIAELNNLNSLTAGHTFLSRDKSIILPGLTGQLEIELYIWRARSSVVRTAEDENMMDNDSSIPLTFKRSLNETQNKSKKFRNNPDVQ